MRYPPSRTTRKEGKGGHLDKGNNRNKKIRELAQKTPILLNPDKQRALWARVSELKRTLIKHGLTSHEDFERNVKKMEYDILRKIENRILKETGLEGEE